MTFLNACYICVCFYSDLAFSFRLCLKPSILRRFPLRSKHKEGVDLVMKRGRFVQNESNNPKKIRKRARGADFKQSAILFCFELVVDPFAVLLEQIYLTGRWHPSLWASRSRSPDYSATRRQQSRTSVYSSQELQY